ncbi:hypothetical protein [Rhizorhapis suberifaciens]|uniref:Uncharacterized protein n=1 Tax=Rhizorhapis suberifaciens TaxID=13656 RepID=A0A840HZ97_9SPHN|nr:hypothetical protein [Rhizorhapis suberifaciens]MBB4642754.1 hypothetical protein [Rhizorhapis suberifaciens]
MGHRRAHVAPLDLETSAIQFLAYGPLALLACAARGDVAAPAIVKLETRALHASSKTLTSSLAPMGTASIVTKGGNGADRSAILITPAKFNLGKFGHRSILRNDGVGAALVAALAGSGGARQYGRGHVGQD